MLEYVERVLAALIILSLLTLLLIITFHPQPEVVNPGPPPIPEQPWAIPDFKLNLGEYTHLVVYFLALTQFVSLITTWVGVSFLVVPGWGTLKNALENPTFKLSYVALLIIPIIVFLIKEDILGLKFDFTVPINLKLSWLVAASFSVSTIIHAVAAPDVEDGNAALKNAANSRLFMRWLCYTAFMYGVVLTLVILFRTFLYIYSA